VIPTRRTQAERRAATIAKLLDATIQSLAEAGYAATSTKQICARAGVSQGGLFRHFPTRTAVIAAATAHIAESQVAAIEALGAQESLDAHGLVTLAQRLTRSDAHAAWHEVMVAARADPLLREAVAPALMAYEASLHALARSLVPDGHPDPFAAEVVVLTVLHAFDSEAVTRRVHSSPDVENARVLWAERTLRALMEGHPG